MKKCYFCKEEIADNAAVCPYCGKRQAPNSASPSKGSDNSDLAPLENFVKKSTLPKSQKAIEHFERARNISTKDSTDRSALNDQAIEFAFAIKEAQGNFPAAHAFLGSTFLALGDWEKARRELNTAIQQDKYNIMARAFLIMLDTENLGTSNVQIYGSLLFVIAGALATGGAAQGKINKLSKDIDNLAKAFREDINDSNVLEYWITCAELLLLVHDQIQGVKGLRGKDRLAKAVVNTPWEKIVIPPISRQEIDNLKKKAEGRMYLASQ